MEIPKDTKNEKTRLKVLQSYNILDSQKEKDFDDLTELASEICGSKISLVSLIDDKRQWFKSKTGLDINETPKEFAFCGHAIHEPNKVFEIEDARKDLRFHDNPLVTGEPYVISYAGIPLVTDNGIPLGTLCVIGDKPKKLNESQLKALKTLAKQAMNLIELRKTNNKLLKANNDLATKQEQLEQFSQMAAHDLKSPLANILTYLNFILDDSDQLNEEQTSLIKMIQNSSEQLKDLIDELLEFSKIDYIAEVDKKEISSTSLIQNIKGLIPIKEDYILNVDSEIEKLFINNTAIKAILINLISNSIKYTDKENVIIDLKISENSTFYYFSFKDNGPGIPPEKISKIFKPFTRINNTDKYGKHGTGLGLAYIKKIIEKLGGSIVLEPNINSGFHFKIKIKK